MNPLILLNRIVDVDSLERDTCDALKNRVTTRRYKAGQVILYNRSVLAIQRGAVKISTIRPRGDVVFKAFARQGDIFGNFFVTETTEYALVVSDDATVSALSIEDLQHVLKDKVMARYVSYLEHNIRKIEEYHHALMTQDVKSRVIVFLEQLAQTAGQQTNNRIVVEGLLSTDDIAQSVFASRQSVSAYLKELENAGWIKRTRREIVFTRSVFEYADTVSVEK